MTSPLRAALALALLGPAVAAADTVTLANGDQFSGRVVSMADETLVFATDYAGQLSLPWSEVAGLETDAPLTVRTATGGRVSARITGVEDGALQLRGTAPDTLALGAVTAINPPPEGLKTSGFVDAGASVSQGNSEAKSYTAAGEWTGRLAPHRLTLGAEYYRSEEDGELSAENARAYGRYARFVSEQWFLGGNASLEHDPFRDLDLRTTVGVSLGYQPFDRDDLVLAFEAGANYVRDDFDEGQDESYPAARFAVDYQQTLADAVTLFHNSELLPPLDAPDEYVLTTRTGVRLPLVAGVNATAQVNVDYDNDPPAGTERADTLYTLRLGYSW